MSEASVQPGQSADYAFMQHDSADRREHVVCCLGTSISNEAVIEAAVRTAQARQAEFTALFVEPEGKVRYSQEEKNTLKRNMQLAAAQGASVEVIKGSDTAYTISEYCRINNVTQLMLGHSNMKRRSLFHRKPLSEKLMRLLPNLDLHIIPDYAIHLQERRPAPSISGWREFGRDLFKTLLALLMATVLCFLFDKSGTDEAVIAPVYLLAVLITAINTETWYWPALSAGLSVLLFNFLFAAPRYSFAFYNKDYLVIFMVTFVVALIAGFIGSQIHRTSVQTSRSSWRTKTLLDATHMLQSSVTPAEIVPSMCQMLSRVTGRDVIFYTWQNGTLQDLQSFPAVKGHLIDPETLSGEMETALEAIQKRRSTGAGMLVDPQASWTYFPWMTKQHVYGVVGINFDNELPESIEYSMIRSLIAEGALTMENRIQEREVQEIRMKNQSTELRSNMLRAISHDLRTPLTSIVGGITNLADGCSYFSRQQIQEICTDVLGSSLIFSNMVENLLTAARFDNGTMPVKMSPELLDDVLQSALHNLSSSNQNHPIHKELSEEILVCEMDSSLISQVISNMVVNAFQHTPEGTPVTISTRSENGMAVVEVADLGPGVSDEMKPEIFDLFYTGAGRVVDSTRSLGLGLYLCQAIIKAHGGEIHVADNQPNGARFYFALPLMKLSG